jgi:hypothetical protein
MNLARHAAVLWRFRRITAVGLLLGIFFAVLASYSISPSGLEPRGVSTYSSQSQLLVTQAGFPEGRVVLPVAPPGGAVNGETPEVDPNRLEFADPGRFNNLADLYTKLIVSDEVLRLIPEHPSPTQILASPLPAVSGAAILPIIQLDTLAESPAAATRLNLNTAKALRDLIEDRAKKNDISPAQRVQITTLVAPSPGKLATGPSYTASILALLLCLIGTVAVTHLLENLRTRRETKELDEFENWEVDGVQANGNGVAADGRLEAAFASEWGPPASSTRRVQ